MISETLVNTPDRELFNRQQAAAFLGIGLNLLDDYRKRGLLKSARLGRRIIIRKRDCFELLDTITDN